MSDPLYDTAPGLYLHVQPGRQPRALFACCYQLTHAVSVDADSNRLRPQTTWCPTASTILSIFKRTGVFLTTWKTPGRTPSAPPRFSSLVPFLAPNAGWRGRYLALEDDWLTEQWSLLERQPWFRGKQQREEAEAELLGQSPGSFVVRVSTTEPGHYAISTVQFRGQMDHQLILPSRAGSNGEAAPGNTRYRLGTYSKELFNTIPKLCAYYIDRPYIDVRRLQGTVVSESQPGGYVRLFAMRAP